MVRWAVALLLLCSTSAYAEWVELVVRDEDGQPHYVHRDSLVRDGDIARMWTLMNHADKSGSVIRLYEFDCKYRRRRLLLWHQYSEPMAKGPIIATLNLERSNSVDWEYVIPDSFKEAQLSVACKK